MINPFLQGNNEKSSHNHTQKTAIFPKQCKIGPRLLWWTNRKLHSRFQFVPKSMTSDNKRPKRHSCINKKVLRSPPEKFQWRQIHTISGSRAFLYWPGRGGVLVNRLLLSSSWQLTSTSAAVEWLAVTESLMMPCSAVTELRVPRNSSAQMHWISSWFDTRPTTMSW